VMNLNTWNKIPKDLQDAVIKTIKDREEYYLQKEKQSSSDAISTLQKNGMQRVEFSAADAKLFTEKVYSAGYAYWFKQSGDDGAKLFKMLQKTTGK